MRAGEFPDGSPGAAGEDRHGRAEHQPARPGALPDSPCHPSPYRRRLVPLPDVRLRPRPVRFHRGDHPLDLHPRVRGPSPPVRLVVRGPGDLPSAADRVRPPQPDLHGDEQAPPAGTGQRGACRRLGRSAHADPLGDAPARLSGGGDPHLLRADRGGQERQHHRHERARGLRPRRTRRHRAAGHGRCCARSRWSSPTTRKGRTEQFTVPNHPKEPALGTRTLPFGRELYIEQDDFMEDPPGKYFRLAPGREVRLRYGYIIRCDEVVKDPGQRRDRRAALQLRSGHRRRRAPRTAARSRGSSTGWRRRMR